MYRLVVLLLLLLANLTNAQTEDLPRSRPGEKSEATKVLVSLYVIDLEGIDNKEQSFTLDIIVRLKWDDQRLSDEKGPIPLDKIWHPKVQIYNLREVETRFQKAVLILDEGTIQYTQRYHATLSSQLDFSEFPFDVQTLPISLVSFGFAPDEVELLFEAAGSEEKFSISDWKVEPIGATTSQLKVNVFGDYSEEILRSRLDYEFKATRYIHFYWWKVLAPLMVILFLSWAVFWIDPSQVGAQIGVAGTSILTLIAFLLRLDNFLPPVSYLTHMDHFIFTSLVLVFIAYIEALISITFAFKGKTELARKLDITFRIVYPIVFLIILVIFWIR